MDTLLQLVQTANAYLSDYILIVMLVGCGLYYSIRTRFVQVRCLGEGMRRVFGGFSLRGGKQSGGMSSFQALATAVAAQVGTGNIVGACGAKLVPVMACIYLLGGLVLLICRIQYIPETFAMIFRYAFTPNAIIGGSLGYALKTAISQGAKRGLFSNEAGMGSTPHAHALAKVEKPHDQGTVAMVGMFIDTFVVLTLTALVVISTLYAGDGILAHGAVDGVSKTNMAQMAFSMVFGESIGNGFVAICLLFFAFSTIIGWNLFGRINVKYLFGQKADKIYSVLAMIFLFLGSILSNDLVWELTDFFNNLMVIPNVIGLLALGGAVAAAAKAGEAAYKEKKKHKV